MKKLFPFVLFVLLVQTLSSQNKTDYYCEKIFFFAKNAKFPNIKEIQTFKIAVFGKNSEIYKYFVLNYSNKKIHEKPVQFINITRENEITNDINIMVIEISKNKQIKDIYNKISANPTLILTIDAPSLEYTMVNLHSKDQNYDINTFNLSDIGIVFTESILAQGGSKQDLQQLYNKKVSQLNAKNNELIKKEKQLEKKNKESAKKDSLLNIKDKELKEEKRKLDSISKALKKQEAENKQKEILLQEKDEQLTEKERKIYQQAEELNLKNITISYQKRVIVISIIFTIILVFLLLVILKQLKKIIQIKKQLEHQNEEIRLQNEKIIEQSKEIEKQRDLAIKRGEELEIKNKEIQDSINYAVRIQQAMMPETNILKEFFKQYFIFYKPRDVVSGDFYWTSKINDKILVIAADCTGHGVPGAMMSMLSMSIINRLLETKIDLTCSEILNYLNYHITKSLKQQHQKNLSRSDGMDAAMFLYNKESNIVEFSGANNPLYIVSEQIPEIIEGINESMRTFELETSNYKIYEIIPDKRPVGIYYGEDVKFKDIKIKVFPDTYLIMFSDGFVEMYDFETRKKYTSKRFKELILKNSSDLLAIHNAIENDFLTWTQKNKQIDDILIITLKI